MTPVSPFSRTRPRISVPASGATALNARLDELAAEKRELEGRRNRLELPAIDREMLSGLVSNFEGVMAEGTNPQKKHLLRRLVKKVLIHDWRTVEVWYGLPNSSQVSRPGEMAPRAGLEPATSRLTADCSTN